eukprot:470110-Amphidinium_carterae.1
MVPIPVQCTPVHLHFASALSERTPVRAELHGHPQSHVGWSARHSILSEIDFAMELFHPLSNSKWPSLDQCQEAPHMDPRWQWQCHWSHLVWQAHLA